MLHHRLTSRQARQVRAGYSQMLRFSQERRAKFLAERELRAQLKACDFSESAIAELVEIDRQMRASA